MGNSETDFAFEGPAWKDARPCFHNLKWWFLTFPEIKKKWLPDINIFEKCIIPSSNKQLLLGFRKRGRLVGRGQRGGGKLRMKWRGEWWKGTEFLHPRPSPFWTRWNCSGKQQQSREGKRASGHSLWNRTYARGPPRSLLHQSPWQRLPWAQLLLPEALLHPGLLKGKGSCGFSLCSWEWSGVWGGSHSSHSSVGRWPGSLTPTPATLPSACGHTKEAWSKVRAFRSRSQFGQNIYN